MMISTDFDVAVIGAGPGGSAAAKRCAEGRLKTVLIEKRKLPRNKVCTGLIMSDMAQTLVKEEFGDPPEEILTTPPYVSGIKFHAPGVETLTLEHRMPFAWRKDFDYWLNQVAQEAGVELWDKARVRGIAEDANGYALRVVAAGEARLVKARFLIGADGTISVVRKALFPGFRMEYQLSIRRCYQGGLALDSEYVHYFALPDLTIFDVNIKDDVFLLEIGPRPGQKDGTEIVRKAEAWLSEDFGFTPGSKPLWRDGCLEPAMVKKPFSGPFPLAKFNALLVGNAAGLTKRITGEGIGTAIKSGLMAGEAVIQSSKKGKRAETFYLPMAQDMVSTLGGMYPPRGKLRDEAKKGMAYFLETVKRIFWETIGIL